MFFIVLIAIFPPSSLPWQFVSSLLSSSSSLAALSAFRSCFPPPVCLLCCWYFPQWATGYPSRLRSFANSYPRALVKAQRQLRCLNHSWRDRRPNSNRRSTAATNVLRVLCVVVVLDRARRWHMRGRFVASTKTAIRIFFRNHESLTIRRAGLRNGAHGYVCVPVHLVQVHVAYPRSVLMQ